MNPDVTIVDYGVGNISAFVSALKQLEANVNIASQPSDLSSAKKIILPGVGSFDWAKTRLDASGMVDQLNRLVLDYRVPVLGVCVGMHLMANASDEGDQNGLAWINGQVKKIPITTPLQKVPHMGWNVVNVLTNHPIAQGLDNAQFYFLHSYEFLADNTTEMFASSSYGKKIAAIIGRENIVGVQFHPEKSHGWGVSLLSNFLKLS